MKRTQGSQPIRSIARRSIAAAAAAITVVCGILLPTVPASAAVGFVSPVSGHVGDIVGGCDPGSRPTHEGVDINQNGGTAVYAAAGGYVSTAINSNATTGYGTQIVITHPDGYTTRYAHMVYGSLTVGQGSPVAQGQRIGTVGDTGGSQGAHMHFEIKRNGANITNNYFYCGQPNVTALQYLGAGPTTPGGGSGSNADYNGDGKADLLGIDNNGQMTAYNGNGNGGWNMVPLGPGWGTTKTLVHGDFNNDGLGDIQAIRNDGSLWFYRGQSGNAFAATQVGGGWGGFSLVTGGADFNNDGRADLVGRAADSNLYMYPGNGAGGFGSPVQIGTNWSGFNLILAGDFGTDGKGDILARNSAGNLFLYAGNGTNLNPGVQVGNGWAGMTAIVGGVDYGLDGTADVLARDAAGNLLLYPGLGGSGFGAPITVGYGWNGLRLIV